MLTSAGTIEVRAPRVNDKRTDPATGERKRFSSAILPPWARKSPQITEVLPLLYLHGRTQPGNPVYLFDWDGWDWPERDPPTSGVDQTKIWPSLAEWLSHWADGHNVWDRWIRPVR